MINIKDLFCSNFGCDEIADQIHNIYIRPGPRHFDEIGGFFSISSTRYPINLQCNLYGMGVGIRKTDEIAG